jgi:arsenate reductase
MAERWVLFVCVENAARSLMAEALFNADAPPGWRATSAGTRPAAQANPRTGPMLAELGISAPAHPPNALTPELLERSELRVTMGCLDDQSCPARLKSMQYRDWGLPDPVKLSDAGFRSVRDDLARRIRELQAELRRAPAPSGSAPRGPTA